MEKKFYNFETMFSNLRDGLRYFLKANNIYYELSSAGRYYHFEIKADVEEVILINEWLDKNTFIEVR